MEVQNVPARFMRGAFIYIPLSWIITKPYPHMQPAQFTCVLVKGEKSFARQIS